MASFIRSGSLNHCDATNTALDGRAPPPPRRRGRAVALAHDRRDACVQGAWLSDRERRAATRRETHANRLWGRHARFARGTWSSPSTRRGRVRTRRRGCSCSRAERRVARTTRRNERVHDTRNRRPAAFATSRTRTHALTTPKSLVHDKHATTHTQSERRLRRHAIPGDPQDRRAALRPPLPLRRRLSGRGRRARERRRRGPRASPRVAVTPPAVATIA